MYYYVFAQPENKNQAGLQDKIRTNLEELRIVGEIVKANPAQHPEELTMTGLAKGYNTVVIVGPDSLVNRVSGIIAEKKAVMGIIPLTEKSVLFELLGVKNAYEAISILPHRRVDNFDLVRIGNEGKTFLTKVDLVPARTKATKMRDEDLTSSSVLLDFDTYKVSGRLGRITITNGIVSAGEREKTRRNFSDGIIDIFLGGKIKKSIGFFERIFSKEEIAKPSYSSLFHTSRVKITASPLMAILTESHIIGKTPTELASVPGRLKLIISREKARDLT